MATPASPSMDIAVVGMACRFPGDAKDTKSLWEILSRGKDAWSEPPPSRFNAEGWYHPDPGRQGSFHIRGAHFLKQDVAAFDAPFFSISTAEAASMDPQQRFLLEVTYEALESAGIPIKSIEGSETSVFCGSFVRDYEQPCMRDPDSTPPYAATGTGIAILANRVSHVFDLAGTSQTIDTGCSASLVCVHQACRSLASGESSLAIAAGVGLIFSPNTMVPMAGLNIMSPDGRCFTFDERANGYGRGEGIGVVILKRVEDAIRDNDTIRAVIRGTRSNQDGRTQGITLPSKERQVANISGVYRDSGLDASRTAYVECHGTGTQAGDFLELHAVSESLCKNRSLENPILVSSVKPNIGHLEGSAGVAGLIKGILVVENGYIPKHVNFDVPNPRIDFDALKVQVPRTTTPWPVQGLRRASVNSFGFGGTNAHAILDDAAHYLSEHQLEGHHSTFLFPGDELRDTSVPSFPETQLYVFSGYDAAALQRVLAAQTSYIRSHLHDTNFPSNYAYTLFSRRSKLDCRTFVVARSPEELLQKLENGETAPPIPTPKDAPPKIAFVFCGQGAQWYAMGRELLQYDIFGDSIDAASRYLLSLGSPFSLAEELGRDEASSRVSMTEIAQPATTAIQVALVDLLRACEVTPTAVVGHSSGEIAAAYAAGAISREDAWKIAFHRGRCAATLEREGALKGAMLAVALDEESVQGYLNRIVPGSVQVACVNGPASITLSGDQDQIVRVQEILRSDEVRATRVNVNVAYHSHHMLALADEYRDAIGHVQGRATSSSVAMYSSAYGRRVQGTELDGEYWVRNLIAPVAFYQTLSKIMTESRGYIFVELSPTRVWESTISQIRDKVSPTHNSTPSISVLRKGRSSTLTFLHALGFLWAKACRVCLDDILTSRNAKQKPTTLVDLPSYPWNHGSRYWSESRMSAVNRFRPYGREDLLGARLENTDGNSPAWRGFFRTSENPWLREHEIQGSVLFPAGGLVAMAVRAGQQLATTAPLAVEGIEVRSLQILKPILIPASSAGLEHVFQATLVGDATYEFRMSTTQSAGSTANIGDVASWTLHAKGTLVIHHKAVEGHENIAHQRSTRDHNLALHYRRAKGRCVVSVDPGQWYEQLETVGLKYGSQFRNITELRRDPDQGAISAKKMACATIVVHDTKSKMPYQFEFDHLVHPTTLDAMLQTVLGLSGDPTGDPMLPTSISSVYIAANFPSRPGSELVGFSEAQMAGWRQAEADVVFFDADTSYPVIVIQGAGFRSLPKSANGVGYLPSNRNLCSQIKWAKDVDLTAPHDIGEFLDMLAQKTPTMEILFLDTHDDTKLFALTILETGGVLARFSRCVFCPGSTDFLDKASNGGIPSDQERMAFEDDEESVMKSQYDVIFVNVSRIDALGSIGKCLRPGGRIVLEYDEARPSKPLLQAGDVAFLYANQGMPNVKMGRGGPSGKQLIASWRPPVPSAEKMASQRDVVLIWSDSGHANAALSELAQILGELLTDLGVSVQSMRLGDVTRLQDLDGTKSFISLLEYDAHLIFNMRPDEFEALQRLFKIAKDMVWITTTNKLVGGNPCATAFTGLARTLRSEDASRRLIHCILENLGDQSPRRAADIILSLFTTSHWKNSTSGVAETEYMVTQKGVVYTQRLVPMPTVNAIIEKGPLRPEAMAKMSMAQLGRSYSLRPLSVGSVDGPRFEDDADGERKLQPHEVRIAVEGTHLECHDMAAVKGESFDPVGGDVYGIAVEVGSGVLCVQPGSRVMAFHSGTISTMVCVPENMVFGIAAENPAAGYSFSLTAMAMAVFGIDLLRLGPRDFLVIMGAASPTGQMAALVARNAFPDLLLALAYDGPEEHSILQEHMGSFSNPVPDLLDVSDGSFAERIKLKAGGDGADAVFYPTHLHADRVVSCVKGGGVVAQVAFKDAEAARQLLNAQLAHPVKKVHVRTFDIQDVLNNPEGWRIEFVLRRIHKMLRRPDVFRLHGIHQYRYGELQIALARLVQAPYTGLYTAVASPDDQLPVAQTLTAPPRLDSSGAYLLVGGLGGLGRRIAEFLVDHGARQLVFLNRSPPNDDAERFLARLRKADVAVHTFQNDIADDAALATTFDEMARRGLGLRGAVHCAAVVDDAAFANMTYAQWTAAFAPKAAGSLNLHARLPPDLDFLVLLASSSGVIGNRGQANYAAGNAFQDALAWHRAALGRPTFALDLGLVLDAGLVARDPALLAAMKAAGFFGTRVADVLFLVARAIASSLSSSSSSSGAHYQHPLVDLPPQTITAVGTGGLTRQAGTADAFWTRAPLLHLLNQVDAPAGGGPFFAEGMSSSSSSSAVAALRGVVRAAATDAEAGAALVGPVVGQLAQRKGMRAEQVEAGRAFAAYGIDSLDSIFLLGWISRELGVGVQTLEGVTVAELCDDVAARVRAGEGADGG